MAAQSRKTAQSHWVTVGLFGFIVLMAAFGAKYSTLARPLASAKPSAAVQQQIRAQGRQVAALIAADGTHALFARFTPDMARAVPEAELSGLLAQAHTLVPPGSPTGESIRATGGGYVYVGDYGPSGRGLRLSVVFLPGGRIQGLLMRPL